MYSENFNTNFFSDRLVYFEKLKSIRNVQQLTKHTHTCLTKFFSKIVLKLRYICTEAHEGKTEHHVRTNYSQNIIFYEATVTFYY